MPKMIEISAAEYERLQDCIREDGMRIAALIEENKALHQDVRRLTAAQKAKRELEAVDAAPVVHGRWQSNGIHGSVLCRCSECHYDAAAYSFRYCPMCGAKMDGEGKSK